MAADIYKTEKKGCSYIKKKIIIIIQRHDVYLFIFFPHNLPDSISQFHTCRAQKTSQVKPSELKQNKTKQKKSTFTSIILWCCFWVKMLTLALFPVYRCLVWYNQFAFRITIVNNIVQFHCNMCTKSPVREVATIEGTSIHQKRRTNYHNHVGKWAFLLLFQ